MEPRRSLRILAKQKFREEQIKSLSEQSVVQFSPEKLGTSSKHPATEKEVEDTKTPERGRGKGKGRKRKRTPSPSISSPLEKQAKKAKQTSREAQNDTQSCSGVIQKGANTSGSRRYSRRKQNKEEQCAKGNSSNRERESVIVDASSIRKKRNRKQEESTESASDQNKRKSRSRGKSRATEERTSGKGKGRGHWSSPNYHSLPSLVDFTKLNMASPE